MKKFLALTLVLFLSLFIVGESEAYQEIILEGEVISSHTQHFQDSQKYLHTLLIRYKGSLYSCQVFDWTWTFDGVNADIHDSACKKQYGSSGG